MSPLINEGLGRAGANGSPGGQSVVSAGSPLTRLNYFDGKFLRADDLRREQNYLRQLVQLSNQGLGAGIVYGMDTALDGAGRLRIGAGLAMDSTGRALLVNDAATLDIGALIDASRRIASVSRVGRADAAGAMAEFGACRDVVESPGDTPTPAGTLYVICVGHAESLCGIEDVYGRLCEEACVTATDRPLIVEGVVVRALPLTLRTPLAVSRVALTRRHLRSLVAAAYFEDERHVVESLISRAGLSVDVWCAGAELGAVGCVPLGVLGRAGTTTTFFDAWTVRRERMEAPAKRYWAWRMAMRPWDVFLAHVLQFQCQLHEVLDDGPADAGSTDPCASQHRALDEASRYLREFDQSYVRHIAMLSGTDTPAGVTSAPDASTFRLQGGLADLARLRERIDTALRATIAGPRDRVLINGGIVELPSAGYLPIVPGTTTVNEQVRRLLGEGLDLRFCLVRPDYVPHALEEAQHMERISLLAGLDDPRVKPQVDILVPNGEMQSAAQAGLAGFDTQLRLATNLGRAAQTPGAETDAAPDEPRILHGAGRLDTTGAGSAFHFAGVQQLASVTPVLTMVRAMSDFASAKAKARDTLLKSALTRSAEPSPFERDPATGAGMFTNASADAAPASTERVGATQAPLVGVWLSMRCERDPFQLGVAESTPMSLDVALTSASTNAAGAATQVLTRLRVFATFSATQSPSDGAAGRRATGQLSGTYALQALLDTTAGEETSKPFEIDVVMQRGGNATAGTLQVRTADPESSFNWMLEGQWGGRPIEATVKLSLLTERPGTTKVVSAGRTIEVLSASALASPDALTAGGALRTMSTTGLGVLGDEMTRAGQNGRTFVDVAQRLLFPPPPAVDELTVRGTLDWVLFQRRRTKRCAPMAPAPTPVPPRRYQLFALRAKSGRELALIQKQLAGGSTQAAFQPVDVVEFTGGATTMITPESVLLSDWQGTAPGNTLVYGAIATGLAEDVPLANARLGRVAAGVASVSPLEPKTGVLEVLPGVPTGLRLAPGVDGVILLVTVAAVRTTCHEVYRVTANADTLALAKMGNVARLLALQSTVRLGQAVFDVDGADLDGASANVLLTAWRTAAAGGDILTSIEIVPKPNEPAAGDDAMLRQRGRAIGNALGGDPQASVTTHVLQGTWPTTVSCPVVTLVMATQIG